MGVSGAPHRLPGSFGLDPASDGELVQGSEQGKDMRPGGWERFWLPLEGSSQNLLID